MSTDPPEGPLYGAQLSAAITDSISELHARYYGKGPSAAKTYVDGDFVFCVLSEPFTTVEKTLIEVGRHKSVRDMRQSFQDAMGVRFSRTVEALTGRKVIAFMSQTHVGPDLAVEMFELEPESGDALI